MSAHSDKTFRSLTRLVRSRVSASLSAMEIWCKEFGSPDQDARVIHVTGTNGKGSICVMLERILRVSGSRVGLYTSPHLLDICERIQVNGKKIPHKQFDEILSQVLKKAQKLNIRFTYFEAVTAVAFEYFKRTKVDWVILETGLGGRWDATNVIRKPDLCIISNVSLEHENFLGDTVAKIAEEKSGILKNNVPCVTAARGEALAVIRKIAQLKKAPLFCVGSSRLKKNPNLSLRGKFQKENLAVVQQSLKILQDNGVQVSRTQLEFALKNVVHPGRLEVFRRGRRQFILDGAHNPAAAAALAGNLKSYGSINLLIFNVMADKNYEGILDQLFKKLRKDIRVWIVKTKNPRELKTEILKSVLQKRNIAPIFFQSGKSALTMLKKMKGLKNILVTGSLFLVAEFLKELRSSHQKGIQLQERI